MSIYTFWYKIAAWVYTLDFITYWNTTEMIVEEFFKKKT